MEKELQEQFEKVLSDNVGNFWEGNDNIISFIDQNFIGKGALKNLISNFSDKEERIIKGQRFLVKDEDIIPVGYPYPETRERYIVNKLLEQLK